MVETDPSRNMMLLENFPVIRQQTPYSCGYATICMLGNFFDQGLVENDIPKDLPQQIGLPPNRFISKCNKFLKEISTSELQVSAGDIISVLQRQLTVKLPVPILYAVQNDFDKKNMVIHYGIVIGLDTEGDLVKVADPFGYVRELTKVQLLESMAYDNYTDRPFFIKLAISLGVLKRNTLFVLK